ncbi:MAG: galactose mutarotase [Streptococcaceae bacterium]|jgi:aldose 1-epimerase|nr:galactose mutarotase [Streptococcaceae bacterium]
MSSEISVRKLPLASGFIQEITLSNGRLSIVVHDFGARLHKLFAPDRHGKFENILLPKDDPTSYMIDKGYYGLICGPVAGRIAGAKYDNVRFTAKENGNLLHSGDFGWARQFWNYEILSDASTGDPLGVELTLLDEKSGFPGPIQVKVTYKLMENQLEVKMSAQSQQETLFNPAWHPYFNLSADRDTTLGHILTISANQVVETDDENIPTGRLLDVANTAYDLRAGKSIAEVQETLPAGLDDCFIFSPQDEKQLTLLDPNSGRKLSCQTDRQAVVIYTATNPEQDSTISGRKMSPNRGIAIECQEIPDIVHHPEWGSITLKAEEEKTCTTTYTFTVEDSPGSD